MSLSDYDRHHIQEILDDRTGEMDWFSAQLIRLINRADPFNRRLLGRAFPEHVEAFEDWLYERGVYAVVVEDKP